MKVAGKKKIVIAAMTPMTALSRDVAIATVCELLARFVLVDARLRLVSESRWAIPE